MEPIMKHPTLRNVSVLSAVSDAHVSRAGYLAMAALVLAASAFIAPRPAAAATGSAHAAYCLAGEAENDCGFTSLAQCEATASGGLGECNRAIAAPMERGRFQVRSNG
jgi:Protein of unknown function (DUF3551)